MPSNAEPASREANGGENRIDINDHPNPYPPLEEAPNQERIPPDDLELQGIQEAMADDEGFSIQ